MSLEERVYSDSHLDRCEGFTAGRSLTGSGVNFNPLTTASQPAFLADRIPSHSASVTLTF